MTNLTDDDRRRFASWLEENARTNIALAEQMQKIGVPDVAIRKYRADAAAMTIVANILRSTEADEVRG